MLDRDHVLGRVDREYLPGLALRPARHYSDHVTATYPKRGRCFFCPSHRYHTSGASETILVKFFSRSSRATGPKTRVPTGSFASLINTAALSSKRMYVPSFRRCSLRVRTTTAFTTLPFLIGLSGAASFTEAVITSPNPARLPTSPPSGRMHVNWRAPELSATVSQLRI